MPASFSVGLKSLGASELEVPKPRRNGTEYEQHRPMLTANINRRHLTKGQRAMAVAKLYPEASKGGRGKTVLKQDGLSKQRISYARVVLEFAPDLADAVLGGSK